DATSTCTDASNVVSPAPSRSQARRTPVIAGGPPSTPACAVGALHTRLPSPPCAIANAWYTGPIVARTLCSPAFCAPAVPAPFSKLKSVEYGPSVQCLTTRRVPLAVIGFEPAALPAFGEHAICERSTIVAAT